MFKITIERPPRPKKTEKQIETRSWNRKLTAATLVILFALAAHIGLDILGRSYLEYELSVCEFNAQSIKKSYEYALAEKINELEICEITIGEVERYLREQGI